MITFGACVVVVTLAVLPDFGPLAPCELQPAAVRDKRAAGPKLDRGYVR